MINYSLASRCFVESKDYDYETNKFLLENYLFENNICKRIRDKFVFNVTGVLISNKEILVIFPKSYNIPSDEFILKEHIKNLVEVLIRYKDEHDITEEEKELLGSSGRENPQGIAAALWLIRDFENNGYITRHMRKHQVGFGSHIDWAKTIREKTPFISNGAPVYFDVYVKELDIDYQNLLYQLHIYCVKKSHAKYGWIIGYTVEKEETDSCDLPCDMYTAWRVLKLEMESTFIEREINLIKAIQEFIFGTWKDEDRYRLNTFATPYFQYVWESICSSVFLSEYSNLSKMIPKPKWYLKYGYKQISQRPDILYIEDNMIYILDAKYYDTKLSLPGWHDLVKQFFYGFSISKNTNMTIRNVLIFPSSSIDRLLEFGEVQIEQHPDLGNIKAVGMDIYESMRCYAQYKTEDYRSILKELFG